MDFIFQEKFPVLIYYAEGITNFGLFHAEKISSIFVSRLKFFSLKEDVSVIGHSDQPASGLSFPS